MQQPAEDKRGPGLRFPPPLLPVVLVGGAWLLERWFPLPLGGSGRLLIPGILLITAALALAVASLLQFLRAKTHVEPWHPTTTIIQSGVFRFSRNPIYLAFCIASAGCGLVLDSWWVIAAVIPLVLLLQALVIRKEEAYLESKFGESYLAYKKRVRRWL